MNKIRGARTVFRRILKLSLRVLLFLFITLALIVLSTQLKPVQRALAGWVSDTLTEKTGGEIQIDRIAVTLDGKVIIEDMKVCDPNGDCFFDLNHLLGDVSLYYLIRGRLNLNRVEIKNLKAKLRKESNGLNIKFIIDSFKNPDRPPPSEQKEPLPFSISFGEIDLRNIDFRLIGKDSSSVLDARLGEFISSQAEIDINPNHIKVVKASMKDSWCKIYNLSKTDSIPVIEASGFNNIKLPYFDFYSGFEFDVGSLKLMNNQFLLENATPKQHRNFDTDHMDLRAISLELSDVIMRKDSLNVILTDLSATSEKFRITDLDTEISANLYKSEIRQLFLKTGNSELNLQMGLSYNYWPDLLDQINLASSDITLNASLNNQDLEYFLPDSISNLLRSLNETKFELNSELNPGSININRLNLVAGESRLNGSGEFENFTSLNELNWENLDVNLQIGSEFRTILESQTKDLNIPSQLQVSIRSSGKVENFSMDGKLYSSYGILKSIGTIGIQEKNVRLNLDLDGEQIEPGKLLNEDWLGSTNLAFRIDGNIDDNTELNLDGVFTELNLQDHVIDSISVSSFLSGNSLKSNIDIKDPEYTSSLEGNLEFNGPVQIDAKVNLDKFKIGKLLDQDSTFNISGSLNSVFYKQSDSLFSSNDIERLIMNSSRMTYQLDSLILELGYSPSSSSILLDSDDFNGNLSANFNITQLEGILKEYFSRYLPESESEYVNKNQLLEFNFNLKDDEPLTLFNIALDDFSDLELKGFFDESKEDIKLTVNTDFIEGFNTRIDSFYFNIDYLNDSLGTNLHVGSLYYDTLDLGEFNFQMSGKDGFGTSRIDLLKDSVFLLLFESSIARTENEIRLQIDSLSIFNQSFEITQSEPFIFLRDDIIINPITLRRDSLSIYALQKGNETELAIQNFDLTLLNYFLDTTYVENGILEAGLKLSKSEFYLKGHLNNLIIYDSNPIELVLEANQKDGLIPYSIDVLSEKNNISLDGEYKIDTESINGELDIALNSLEDFKFIFRNSVEDIKGSMIGNTKFSGPFDNLEVNGFIDIKDTKLVTSKPRLTTQIIDERILFNERGLQLNNFKIYDSRMNPLSLNGYLNTNDYRNFEYDLNIKADNYVLVDNPVESKYTLQGKLIVATDITLTGNTKDAYARADLIIKDSTDLSIITEGEEIELVTNDGIVEFYDPYSSDTMTVVLSTSFYDSLIANLPDFNFQSNLKIDQGARIGIVIDPASGDYIESYGDANLDFGFDRTGNISLSGDYTIKQGSYQLSFYNIVRKRFDLTENSYISWNGDPNEGEMNVKAIYTIKTSSIGLIGHEISETEQATYRRSLPYEVSININGTLNEPRIYFGLDLPQEFKTNYPALGNKLDRLKQPEFESELNKQVFALLVLGGFIPETSGSNVNESVIATTAVANSVNSILAAQLNKFTSELIKGVDIDIGLQSYSDFTTGGGQTRTAMDFRVTKRVMDDRMSLEAGGSFDINADQSGANQGRNNFRGDIALVYDLTETGDKKLKAFNNETYDIIYHEVRNTGIALIFLNEFNNKEERRQNRKKKK